MVKTTGGCEFGRGSRMMIETLDIRFREFMAQHKEQMTELIVQNKELYNHQSKRWPPQAVWALSTLSALVGALLTKMLSTLLI